MARAFISVGSNIDPDRNVVEAVRRLVSHAKLSGISTVLRTAAVGRPEQADYYNCVIAVNTELPPMELKRLLNAIERDLGRLRTSDRWAARCIDLDLIVYGHLVSASPELTVPDPDILKRNFLAAGLCELAPTMQLPGWSRGVSSVAAELGTDGLTPLHAYTARLRAAVQAKTVAD